MPDYGADAFFHMKAADVLRVHHDRHRLADWFAVGSFNDYPPLFHWLLSVFPKGFIEKANGFIAPVFDALNAVLLNMFCYMLTGVWWVGPLAWIFYIASPQISIEALSLTPRLLSLFFFNLWFVAMLAGGTGASAVWTSVSIGAGVACFYTGRSQLPLMLAGGVVLTIVSGESVYMIMEAGMLLVAFLLGSDQFIRTFKSYAIMTGDTSRRWRDYGDERDRLARAVGGGGEQSAAEMLKRELKMLFAYNPGAWIALVAGAWLSGFEDDFLAWEVRRLMWAWFLTAFVAFIATQRFPQLGQRAGEGYRQFPEFGAVPGSIIIAVAVAESYRLSPPLFAFLVVAGAASLFMILWIVSPRYRAKLKASGTYINPGLKSILERSRDLPGGNIMCLPTIFNYPMIYYGDRKVVDVVERSVPYRDIAEKYVFGPKLTLAEYAAEFDLDYFLIDTSNPDWSLDYSGAGKVIDSEGPLVIVEVDAGIKNAGRGYETDSGQES